MNKEQKQLYINIAEITLVGREITIWHVLPLDAMHIFVKDFSNQLRGTPPADQLKDKLINFINKHFEKRTAFKSKEQYMKYVGDLTTKEMKARIEKTKIAITNANKAKQNLL